MTGTSKTGLQSGVRHRVPPPPPRGPRSKVGAVAGGGGVELVAEARPAPFVLRPFAGFYNPFPYGCSVLCNHPADCEARDLVKRAKEAWGAAGGTGGGGSPLGPFGPLGSLGAAAALGAPYADGEPAVPEALFRRYTDTDSRPQTPALSSAHGRGRHASPPGGMAVGVVAVGRRCVTPDPPLSASGVPVPQGPPGARGRSGERPLLVLDLRRSLSQEALSWRGLGSAGSAPGASSTNSPAASASGGGRGAAARGRTSVSAAAPGTVSARRPPPGRPRRPAAGPNASQPSSASATENLAPEAVADAGASDRADSPPHSAQDVDSATSADEGSGRRRGKRRRRRKRGDSDGATEPAVQGLPDPQVTQVSTLDAAALTGEGNSTGVDGNESAGAEEAAGAALEEPCPPEPPPPAASFIDPAILRQLQRELDTADALDFEFNPKRRVALGEALRVRGLPPPPERGCAELRRLHRALAAAAAAAHGGEGVHGPDRWLTIPRVASRASARFELPVDSRKLLELTPLQYLANYVSVGPGRQMLFRLVFERHARERRLPIENVEAALTECLGFSPSPQVRELSGWDAAAPRGLRFRQWAGVAALAERLAASAATTPAADPPLEVERVDLAALERRLFRMQPEAAAALIALAAARTAAAETEKETAVSPEATDQLPPTTTTPKAATATTTKTTTPPDHEQSEEGKVVPVIKLLRVVRDA